ncbi:hypothetical protein [Bowmanella denitrificans]|uniref:hypothetical protein n=1 Tax=Bowmanella denitrificans TaxID=366582 RepID=UPI000C9CB87E|nr:hypothetical protein [Bowmanella denitrificans]
MTANKLKVTMVTASLLGIWLLVLWLQWTVSMPLSIHLICVPMLLILTALLAALAMESEDN